MKHALSKRKRAVLEVMSKPKTPAEIREQIGLKRGNNISTTLNQLHNLNLIYCLNVETEAGRLYGLTNKGKTQRKRLLNEKGMPCFYIQPSEINWNLYGKIVIGKQRRAILKAMKTSMPLKYIRERAQECNPRISRTNANDILQFFVRKQIARKIEDNNRIIFSLTRTGETIRNQLMKP